jgi:para-nitrobenzyl esterase
MNSPTRTRRGIFLHHVSRMARRTIDIQFLFADWHGGPLGIHHKLNAREQVLSRQLVAAWTAFMYSGNPNRSGDQPWPRYTGSSEQYFSQNVPASSTLTAAQFAAAHHCEFWDKVLLY